MRCCFHWVLSSSALHVSNDRIYTLFIIKVRVVPVSPTRCVCTYYIILMLMRVLRQIHNNSLIAWWYFLVSSVFVLCVFFSTFHFRKKKNTESSVIILWNGVLILNWKENKETDAICFEIRIPKEKNKELLRKIPSNNYESYCIIEKKQKHFFVCQ